MKKIPFSSISIALGAAFLVFGGVWAFTGPSEAPPGCTSGDPGCDPPLNEGPGDQVKAGGISVGSLISDGSVQLNALGGSAPVCSVTFRGTVHFVHEGPGDGQDTLWICIKESDDVSYNWHNITIP